MVMGSRSATKTVRTSPWNRTPSRERSDCHRGRGAHRASAPGPWGRDPRGRTGRGMASAAPGTQGAGVIGYWALVQSVSGDREYLLLTPDAKEALNWLEMYDHEGAQVSAYVIMYGEKTPLSEYHGP